MPQILKIIVFLLHLSSTLVNAHVHDDTLDEAKVGNGVLSELLQTPINTNVVQEPMQLEDTGVTKSEQSKERKQDVTEVLPVQPTIGEFNPWSFDDNNEEPEDALYSEYDEEEEHVTEPREDGALDTESLYPTTPDYARDGYDNIIYEPNKTYFTEEEERHLTGSSAGLNEVHTPTEPELYVTPEQHQLPHYNSGEEEINTTSYHLPQPTPSYRVETSLVSTESEAEDWGHFDIDDYQGQRKVQEELEADLNREPMRQVHRSPVPWLYRDVDRLGQPRQPACLMELDRGLGPDEISSWQYDSREMRCRWFGYRGYAGNANRFSTRLACEGYCIKDMENLCELVTCSWTGTQCTLVSDDPCVETARFYRRDWRTKCPPDQPVCMSRRYTRIAPDIDFRGIPVECLQGKDAGSCQRKNPSVMFYYDRERNDCMTFYFHDCGGNDNRFETKSDCMTHCAP